MRKSILALTALVAASAPAFATDYAEPAPEAFSWTGLYAGVFASYNDIQRDLQPVGAPVDFDTSYDGFAGGGLIGFNYQFDSIVMGVEGDIAFASFESNETLAFLIGSGIDEEIDMTYGVRARLGYAMDRTLVFVTGGVAWAEYQADFAGLIPVLDPSLADETLFGWQIGGGIEQALTDNITLRVDYLYTDYESENFDNPVLGILHDAEYDLDSHSIRLGVNFLLGSL